MHQHFIDTTEEQRTMAKKAAIKRYNANLNTPNRINWFGGKCPRSEYRAIIGELGFGNWIGQDPDCLYSNNPSDYCGKPDFTLPNGLRIEVKTGSTFNDKDRDKADLIVFVNPIVTNRWTACDYDTCPDALHQVLTGEVELLGWFDMKDWYARQWFSGNGGYYYKPTGDTFRNIDGLMGCAA